MSVIRFVRLRVDASGGSQLEPGQIALTPLDFAPPASPMDVSPLEPAAGWRFLHLPARWIGDFHPTPARLWIFCLAGEMEFEASDGATHRIAPGSAMLLEDTTGKGHRSRVMGDREALLVAVQA